MEKSNKVCVEYLDNNYDWDLYKFYNDMTPKEGLRAYMKETGQGRKARAFNWDKPITKIEHIWYLGLLARAYYFKPREVNND